MKGDITKRMIEQLGDIISDKDKTDEWMARLEETEPEFYTWTHEMTGNAISVLGKKIRGLTVEHAHELAYDFILAFTSGWVIYTLLASEKLEKQMEMTEEDEFNLWLDGKLGDKYYDYSLRGLKKDSTKYIAKSNHEKLKAEREKRKAFLDIKKKMVKNGEPVIKNVPEKKKEKGIRDKNIDDFLKRFNGRKEKDK
jgi:hypothetical protein